MHRINLIFLASFHKRQIRAAEKVRYNLSYNNAPFRARTRVQRPLHRMLGKPTLFFDLGIQPNFALQTGPADPIALRARARTLRRVDS